MNIHSPSLGLAEPEAEGVQLTTVAFCQIPSARQRTFAPISYSCPSGVGMLAKSFATVPSTVNTSNLSVKV